MKKRNVVPLLLAAMLAVAGGCQQSTGGGSSNGGSPSSPSQPQQPDTPSTPEQIVYGGCADKACGTRTFAKFDAVNFWADTECASETHTVQGSHRAQMSTAFSEALIASFKARGGKYHVAGDGANPYTTISGNNPCFDDADNTAAYNAAYGKIVNLHLSPNNSVVSYDVLGDD